MVKFWSYSLFCTNISYILIHSTLWAKMICSYWQCPSSLISQPSDKAMQLTTHVQDIYGHVSLHSKNEEAAGSCASMLATPIVVVTARIEMYLFLECSKARQKGTKYK